MSAEEIINVFDNGLTWDDSRDVAIIVWNIYWMYKLWLISMTILHTITWSLWLTEFESPQELIKHLWEAYRI